MIYFCCDERRRSALRLHGGLNGIDYLEVLDADAASEADRQRVLRVVLLKDRGATALAPVNVRVEGGERVRDLRVESVTSAADSPLVEVRLSAYGDFSTYTLRFVDDAVGTEPPAGFDPLLACAAFSFKLECETGFDCAAQRLCPPEPPAPPPIDYLAKDYATMRRLMLDRLAALTPGWTERSAADLGVTLVELLAYVGDGLSYRQDAVATEAYLGTARKRVSVRRHARLVDYAMHDGSNARAWIHVRAATDAVRPSPSDPAPLPKGTVLMTRAEKAPARLVPHSPAHASALASGAEVFETAHDLDGLFVAHNRIRFHTWGDRACCLIAGSTEATLAGALPNLRVGDVLLLVEARGARTGEPEDADPARRHAVRLTRVTPGEDPLGAWFEGGADALAPGDSPPPVPITHAAWARADALPFPLCVSAETSGGDFDDVSVALGNVVLADHGRTLPVENLGVVPLPATRRLAAPGPDACAHVPGELVPPRFTPALREGPLTQTGPPPNRSAPASAAFGWNARDGVPAVLLTDSDGLPWTPRRDLLGSLADARAFVAEVDEDGRAALRFGDDANGRRPDGGSAFAAVYRVGNGTRGNVGAGSIAHVVSGEAAIESVTNPLPARGGKAAETIEEVRQNAPVAFRTQERAVTPDDYARAAERHPDVQRAAATFRWTGSWYTVFLTVDRVGGAPVDADFERSMRAHMERFRMAGYDLEVDGPRFVALDLELDVCVKPTYFRADVKRALEGLLTDGRTPDGSPGFFHPDRFTFGAPVYLSPILAAAQSVPGVASVTATKFERQGLPSAEALDAGRLEVARLEIARLDNDANAPERGRLTIHVRGGK